jgi:hypothetical protein
MKNLAIMKPDIEIIKRTATQENEMMFDLIPQVSTNIAREIISYLEEKDLELKIIDISEEELRENPALRTDLGIVREAFDRANSEILIKAYRKGKDKEFNFSMGSGVNQFADRAGVDALLFVRGKATKKSGGAIAKDVAKSVLIGVATLGQAVVVFPSGTTMLQAAVVDADTGDVLWYNLAGDYRTDCSPDNEKCIRRLVKKIFKKFPDSE